MTAAAPATLGGQGILLVAEGPRLTRSGVNADLDAAAARIPYTPELRAELAKAHTQTRGRTHIAIHGTGILCRLNADQPYTRTIGTWTPWDGHPPSCRDCAWHLNDHLYDQEP